MGHTLGEWIAKVGALLKDSSQKDIGVDVEAVGIRPAIGRYSIDRPYEAQADAVGNGTAYYPVPPGWLVGFSILRAVEFPAHQNPPQFLDDQEWTVCLSPSDITSWQVMFLTAFPGLNQSIRYSYTVPWAYPTTDATVDLIDTVAFEAVSALAAAHCCRALAIEAARNLRGALPTDLVDGTNRVAILSKAADAMEAIYERFLGLQEGGPSSGLAPVSVPMDLDPSFFSLFHGGRR